ncbi:MULTISPECIES: glycosyltransferase [Rhodomicrobium]|uniref:glycosyltransferase family 2 protein n=1 Tax=Rhodomicrobium TaxID=1068 RepID=UPI000B4BDB68|nr:MULTISPECIES: glycosyltransferase [Rhodomicrobium]
MISPVPSLPPERGNAWRIGPRGLPILPVLLPPRAAPRAPPLPAPVSEDAILAHAGVPPPMLARLRALALRWGVPLREAALSTGAVQSAAYLRALAIVCGIRPRRTDDELRLRRIHPAPEPYRQIVSRQPVPLEAPMAAAALNGESFTPASIAELARELGPAKDRLCLVGQRDLAAAIARSYGPELALAASAGLGARHPRFSAAIGLNGWQTTSLSVAAGLFLGAAIFATRETLVVYSAALSLMFMLTICLRCAAAGHACYRRVLGPGKPLRRMRCSELPRYTVLVAMYREARVLPQLVAALEALDYPAAKLDVKLVLEADDAETIAAAQALRLAPYFEIVIVPPGTPRTKPRALNYALQFATGEYLVIYDAEDRPDAAQLLKAASHFHSASSQVVCLQAKLIFDNASENWLAKQFTIEYASLFGGILPMLDKARLPMPLGGTSNHFRTEILRKLGGWDAHNVTEDADLGMRLYRCGLRAEVLESTTFEEAACQPGNWIRQRTRWLKGWMQTYGVHMRQPARLYRELGPAGFLAFQGHFAGIIIAALVYPLSFVLIVHDAAAGMIFAPAETAFGHQLWMIAVFNLVAGYAASLALGLFVLKGRSVRRLAPQLVFIPVYWLFISAAAYRAVYQLITAPHYWEKTEHGVTRVSRVKNNR